jgi:hypothetical protein
MWVTFQVQDNNWAFLTVVLIMIEVAIFEIILFRKKMVVKGLPVQISTKHQFFSTVGFLREPTIQPQPFRSGVFHFSQTEGYSDESQLV